MQIISQQVGQPQTRTSAVQDGLDADWVSSFWKTPTLARVRLGREDLDGNAQADLKNHGGPEKAVCAYAASHYPTWREALGLAEAEFTYGAFGENWTLTGEGLTEEAVCVGDIYAVGTARVQVSQPRMPCWKVGRRWERPSLPHEVTATGRTGWYFRVLAEGEVGAGDTLVLEDRPLPEWSVARINQAMYVDKADADLAEELSRLPLLAEAWRRPLRRRAGLLRSRMQ